MSDMYRENYNSFYRFIILVFIFFITVFYFISCNTKSTDNTIENVDLFDHPIYSKYDFENDKKTINVGIQPMYLPTGIILEAVKRDKILNEAISDLGLNVRYYSFLKGADVNYFLGNDKLACGVGGQMPAITAACNYNIIIPIVIQKGNVSIISYKPILTDDLKGKRIGYPHGSISHYFILDLIESSGISENSVSLIPMEVTELGEALNNHEIDLLSAWEPVVSMTLKKYPEFFVTYQNITSGYLYFRKDFVNKNKEFYSLFVTAIIRSIQWIKSDRQNLLLACKWNIEEIEKLTNKKFELTETELAECAQSDIFNYLDDYFETNLEKNGSIHNEFLFLKKLEKLPQKSSWELVLNSFDQETVNEIFLNEKELGLMKFSYETNR